MTHELRTPLTAILGNAHLLEKRADLVENDRKKLDIIQRNGQNLLDLINNVLQVSRIEVGKVELHYQPFLVQTLIVELESLFQLQVKEKNLSLELKFYGDLEHRIICDEAKLRQILINLIGNACKFTEFGGIKVSVKEKSIAKEKITLEIAVQDSGPGIAPEEFDLLFQPFEQGAAGRKNGGSGLGLALSRKYAQLLGGDLSVKSSPGVGSCFTLTCNFSIEKEKHTPSADVATLWKSNLSKITDKNILQIDSNRLETPLHLAKEDLAKLPQELFLALQKALETLEPTKIEAVTQEIKKTNLQIGSALEKMTVDFKYEEIEKLFMNS